VSCGLVASTHPAVKDTAGHIGTLMLHESCTGDRRREPRRMAKKRRGFGRLRQLPSGRWQAAYIGPDTKLHKAPRTYAAESDAQGWLAIERRKIDLGTWGAVERSDGITLRAYADQWMEQRSLRPRTRQHYESMLERLILPELGDVKIVALTPAKVRM